jgi:hypothetical protein
MRSSRYLVLALAIGCGDDGAMTGDAGSDSESVADARGPNTTRRGLVQGIYSSSGSSVLAAGFYDVAEGAPGCTWSFVGTCSLAVCEMTSGLVAVSAGTITFTIADTPTQVTPDSANAYPSTSVASMPPGTSAMATAAGATVPSFTSAALVMPSPLTVTAPQNNAVVDRSQPLPITWTPAPGFVYVNISQTYVQSLPFPQGQLRTIRCDYGGPEGAGIVPIDLIGQLEPNMQASITVTSTASQNLTAGDFDVIVRLVAYDMTRALAIQ